MQQEMLLGQSTISLGGTSEVIGSPQDHHKIKSSGSEIDHLTNHWSKLESQILDPSGSLLEYLRSSRSTVSDFWVKVELLISGTRSVVLGQLLDQWTNFWIIWYLRTSRSRVEMSCRPVN
jgi:hypothetical protein